VVTAVILGVRVVVVASARVRNSRDLTVPTGIAAIAAIFGIGSVCLLGLAAIELWEAVAPGSSATLASRAAAAIESVGLITVSLMLLEMAQTVIEEEVVRRVHVGAPTRVSPEARIPDRRTYGGARARAAGVSSTAQHYFWEKYRASTLINTGALPLAIVAGSKRHCLTASIAD
jgi:hypothetical protein